MQSTIFTIYTTLLVIFMTLPGSAQVPVPASSQQNPIVLRGGTAHLGDGQVIENAIIAFDKGKFTAVGTQEVDLEGAENIDVSGQHIYPGFILINSQVGLVEVEAVRAMLDEEEEGAINPNVRSVVAYNTDSEIIPTLRFNGILLAESAPVGGAVSGTSSVMEMEGWNWEDACHTMDIGIHMHWPTRTRRRFDYDTYTIREEPNKEYDDQVSKLKQHLAYAKAYAAKTPQETNLKLAAMHGLFSGSKILFLHATQSREIIEAISIAKDAGIEKVVLVSGSGTLPVADFLKDHMIPVVLPPTHSLPERVDHYIDHPYRLPHLLTEAGVEVSLCHEGMLANARNLPFYAGTAAAYGLDKEAALMTISANPAKALGIADKVGTIAVGKDATLFLSDGDALDIRGNKLTRAYIQGKQITLDNKQQALYERYSNKYGHQR